MSLRYYKCSEIRERRARGEREREKEKAQGEGEEKSHKDQNPTCRSRRAGKEIT
jgi:hypothetical protein